jgi:hypothetical protein
MQFLLYITQLYRIRYANKLFLVECPIETCYVREDFQLSTLVKNAPGGRTLLRILRSRIIMLIKKGNAIKITFPRKDKEKECTTKPFPCIFNISPVYGNIKR